MSLNFSTPCQDAIDFAKRSIRAGADLEMEDLLAALFYQSDLEQKIPEFATFFGRPQPTRQDVPEFVPLSEPLGNLISEVMANSSTIGVTELFCALLNSDEGRILLKSQGASESKIKDILARIEETPAELKWRTSKERKKAIDALSSFGRMLTVGEPPHKGVVQREDTLKSIIKTLSKMRGRNPMIIGQPGTGKSAVVYELARRICCNDKTIPEKLRDKDIFELSPIFLKSGASMVGQYEQRVKELIELLEDNPNIMLFIDEIHSLIKSSMHAGDAFSAANEAFKVPLQKGTITVIGCTTTAEYRHYIEPDGAIVRRFSRIIIEPPTSEEAIAILKARKPRLAAFYAPLRIPDHLLERTVELTEEFVLGRFQPDKSIQLIDEACALCSTDDPPSEELTEDYLMQALECVVGHSIVRKDELTEAEVYDKLRSKIAGQDEALKQIAKAFISGLAPGWTSSKSKPRGIFMFGGPTGTGKTETAMLLSRILGGGRDQLLRVDCNTLQGGHGDGGPQKNILLGPPPGYLGYVRGQGGLLSKIRDMPESIVLFDEFEKADPSVGKLLLQILDKGNLEDNDGQTLDFRRTFIIFTTNAGCVYETKKSLGFGLNEAPATDTPQASSEALKAQLLALGIGMEFFPRLTHEMMIFKGLERDTIEEILAQKLDGLRDTAESRDLAMEWTPDIIPHLASQWQPQFGVRHLSNILRNRITEQLNIAEAQGELRGAKTIRLELLQVEPTQKEINLTGLVERKREDDILIISLI